ncbi:hypothetical protein CLIM01_13848 [Colletotrichum limetticola]|uniref:SH3 domain-containing protein n=1 Tax=Colletotrichum limetticola TaxID=1209924 RepID=A0ABQ9P9N0_9PEZI|nr:hypothetical protein CLIM01_13848 [Colletotrichum limetticola]
MTCYGSFVRFWAFDSQSALLTPFYPTEGDDGERTAYVDFKSHENDIMQALAYIKETPIPPSSLFEQPVAYDQPTEAASSQAYYAHNQGHHTEYVSSQSERQNTIASGFSFTDARLEATHDQPMEVDDESGDPVAEPTASTSQATGSKQGPAHKKVDIIKEEHSIRSTKYLFRKHKRGHVITTKIEDWDRIKVQDGKEAWYWKEDNKYWGYKPK